jgi:mevalonate kinase
LREAVTVSAPGKLILLGEHAVVYGRPALVAAVDLRLTVRLSPRPGAGVRLDLPCLSHAEEVSWSAVRAYARSVRESWAAYSRDPGPEGFRQVRGEDPAHVVKAALGEAADFLGEDEPPGLDLRVSSDLPIGSGFGSSAATALGVVAGYLAWRGVDAGRERIESLALEAERRQHGLPSGVDGAAILHGGILWARKTPSGLETETVVPRSSLLSRLRVYDTGTPPEPTGAVVAAVRRLRNRDPGRFEAILDRLEASAADLRGELARDVEESTRVSDLIRKSEACLEELGVVPETVRAVVRRVESEGGAAKISGAGSLSGPGAGSLIVYHPDPERIAGWAFLQPYRHYPVHLGAPGLRRETIP